MRSARRQREVVSYAAASGSPGTRGRPLMLPGGSVTTPAAGSAIVPACGSDTAFDPAQMRAAYAPHAGSPDMYMWNLNPFVLERFVPMGDAEEVSA